MSVNTPARITPRVRSVPEYGFTEGDDAVQLAHDAGLILDDWQADAVRDFMAVGSDGKWLAKNAALIVPRQNGKGTVLEAIVLADMFLLPTSRLVIWTAHEFSTANEAFLRVRGHIQANRWMDRRVQRVTTANGNVGIEFEDGKRLLFKARSSGSQRGFSADRLVYDEAYNLPDATLEASKPSMSARPNPQTIFASSAPKDGDESAVLRRMVARGRRNPPTKGADLLPLDPNLAYVEYSADPKADLDDVSEWRRANPGMTSPRGLPTVETVADERATMSDVGFARERLGIVDEGTTATVLDMDQWDRLGDPLSSALDPVTFAVDVAPDQSFASIAIAGLRADGVQHTEVVARNRGTGWVADALLELQESWEPQAIVLDPIGQGAALVPALDELGVRYSLLSTRDVTSGCAFFYAAVVEGRVRHTAGAGLRAALEAARKRKVGESGWAWNRRDSTDISPLVAVTNAMYASAVATGRTEESTDSRMFFFSR